MLGLIFVGAGLLVAQAARVTLTESSNPNQRFANLAAFSPDQIPQSCMNDCQGALAILEPTCDNSCQCSEAANVGFQQCIDCLLSVVPYNATSVQQSQGAMASFEDSCKNLGFPLTSLVLSISSPTPTATRGTVTIPNNTTPLPTSVIFSSGALPSAPPRITSSAQTRMTVNGPDELATATVSGANGSSAPTTSGSERSMRVRGLGVLSGVVGLGVLIVLGF